VSAPLPNADLGKEFVPRSRSTSTGTSWVLKKCRILVLGAWLARRTHGLDPVDALEGHARILSPRNCIAAAQSPVVAKKRRPEYVPSSFSFLNPSLYSRGPRWWRRFVPRQSQSAASSSCPSLPLGHRSSSARAALDQPSRETRRCRPETRSSGAPSGSDGQEDEAAD